MVNVDSIELTGKKLLVLLKSLILNVTDGIEGTDTLCWSVLATCATVPKKMPLTGGTAIASLRPPWTASVATVHLCSPHDCDGFVLSA